MFLVAFKHMHLNCSQIRSLLYITALPIFFIDGLSFVLFLTKQSFQFNAKFYISCGLDYSWLGGFKNSGAVAFESIDD